MLCMHSTTTSASLDYLSQAYQPVSPSILSHFRWELYHLLPPEENGERHRAKVTRQVVEIIDQDNGQRVENIILVLDIEMVKLRNSFHTTNFLNI